MPSVLAVVGAFALAFLACAWAGLRLPLEGSTRGRRLRRVGWAAAWLAACSALPLTPMLLVPVLWTDPSFPFVTGPHPEEVPGVHPLAAVVGFAVTLRFCVAAVRLPGPWGRRDALPEVEDPDLRARVVELAAAVGAPEPRVLRLGSAGGTQETQAFAHGVVLPTMIVSDGILHRLDQDERDAVLAHELAHLRRRSIPQMVWMVGAAMTAGVVASAWCPMIAGVAWGLLVLAGVIRVHGHFDEVACDLRAGRAIGFRRMASALDKIHGSQLPDDDRALSRWIHATQRHPARTVRLWALRNAAPPDERVAIEVDEALVGPHRRTYVLAALGWLAAVVFGLWWAMQPGKWPGAAGFCLLAALLPVGLLLAAGFRSFVHAAQLGLFRFPWGGVLDLACLVGALVAVFAVTGVPLLARLALLLMALVLAGSLFVRRLRPSARRRKQLDFMFRRHDFAAFREFVNDLPPRMQREGMVRYLAAVARAAGGDHAGAAEELLELAGQRPRMRAALLTASALLRPIDPQRSLAIAERLGELLPRNPFALGRLAAARLHVADIDGAREAVEAGLRAAPRAGVLHALAARIAVRGGDMPAAADHLAFADRWAAGDAQVLLASVEHARVAGVGVEEACSRLREASRHQPLAFVEDEVERVCATN